MDGPQLTLNTDLVEPPAIHERPLMALAAAPMGRKRCGARNVAISSLRWVEGAGLGHGAGQRGTGKPKEDRRGCHGGMGDGNPKPCQQCNTLSSTPWEVLPLQGGTPPLPQARTPWPG